jgi:hypothetical protein
MTRRAPDVHPVRGADSSSHTERFRLHAVGGR